jgi:hypothetical protein
VPGSQPTSDSVERAARHLHATVIVHNGRLDPTSALEHISRETGATGRELLEYTNRVFTAFERIDATGMDPNHIHDNATPAHDTAEVAERLAGALAARMGTGMIVICGHGYPLDEVPVWCRNSGGLRIVSERRQRVRHPDA